MQVFYGETGFAGDNPYWVVPAILVERQPVVLLRGDHVTIWDEGGQVLFAGPIIEVPETTRVQVPLGNPRTFSPAVGEGEEVKHFLKLNRGQLGFPEWWKLFFDPEEDFFTYNRYLRARVIRGLPGMAALYERISQVYWTPPKLPRFAFKVGRTLVNEESGSEGPRFLIDGQRWAYDWYELGAGDLLFVLEHGRLVSVFIIPEYGNRSYWLPLFIESAQWRALFLKEVPYPAPPGTIEDRFTFSPEGILMISKHIVQEGETCLGDANLPALAFTFPPLTAIAKVLQRMLTGPPRR